MKERDDEGGLTPRTIAKVSNIKLNTSSVKITARFSKESVTAGNMGRSIAVVSDAFKCSQKPQTALLREEFYEFHKIVSDLFAT